MVRDVLACILGLLLLPALALAQPTGRSTVIAPLITIAVGSTYQTILAAGNRQSLTIQNNNAVDTCWIYIGAAADPPTKGRSILLLAGGSYTRYYPFIPNDAIQGTCATGGSTIYVDVTGP